MGTAVRAVGVVTERQIADQARQHGIDEAEVGQCLDVSSEDSDSVVITDQDCDGDHDGEITWVGTYADVEGSDFVPTNPDDLTDAGISFAVCTSLMDQGDVDALALETLRDGQDTLGHGGTTPRGGAAGRGRAPRGGWR